MKVGRTCPGGFENSIPITVILINTLTDFQQDAIGDENVDEILDPLKNGDSDEKPSVDHQQVGSQTPSIIAREKRVNCSETTSVPTLRIRLTSSSVDSTLIYWYNRGASVEKNLDYVCKPVVHHTIRCLLMLVEYKLWLVLCQVDLGFVNCNYISST